MDQNLELILTAVWNGLLRAPSDKNSPWRWPALATAGPSVRMVVLRAVRRDPPEIDLFTDARTPKVAQLRQEPIAELLFWDKSKSHQVRVRGEVSVHHKDAIAEAAFGDGARHLPRDYARLFAPGEAVTDPDSARATDGDPWAHFMVLRMAVDAIDWLELSRAGHRRAGFQRRHGVWTGTWLTP
ncbi:MAG: pyridoxamine 5'-phosphate oxidase family protein [Pseudomonadota bacterium]